MELSNIFSTDVFYNLARGPFVWMSLVLCAVGTIVRTIQFISLTRVKKRNTRLKKKTPTKQKSSRNFSLNRFPRFFFNLKLTILGTSPVTILVSCIFHLCLVITPIFLLAHNILIEEAVGFSLYSFSERFTNCLTFIFLICAAYFLIRRVLLSRLRAISSFYDYIILLITTAPFISGCLAYYQVLNYKILIILHMLTGELMLIAIPFTKIYHMVFFFIGRFVLIHQHTFGKGSRTWQSR
jgi:nitrate reductase gamma subunit